jgi:hypothetical protein
MIRSPSRENLMSPEERQLLTGLFDRTRTAAATPRDPEAEALINEQVRSQPSAPYLLAQAVLIQEQALKAANEKLQAQEAQIQELEQQGGSRMSAPPPGGGGFLSGLGALFGGAQQPPRGPAPGTTSSAWQQQPPQGYDRQNYGQPQAPGPWGQQPMGQPMGQPGGGGFLQGALGAAAGVAGGVLLADSIRGLFGGHNNSLGIGAGLDGLNPGRGNETVINNYYDNAEPGHSQSTHDQNSADRADDVADSSYDDPDSGSDYSSDA